MKITIYTITNCDFSKQEKEYLASHNLPYEEKNLESNREYLTEMLSVSNNFAGTPVTKIEKDDGQIAVLKGFTKEEFDTTLGITSSQPAPSFTEATSSQSAVAVAESTMLVPPPPATPVASPSDSEGKPTPTNLTDSTNTPPIAETPPVAPPTEQPLSTPPVNPNPPQQDEALNSILSDLQTKANENQPPTPPLGGPPAVPDFQSPK